jgi:hypothetical protein
MSELAQNHTAEWQWGNTRLGQSVRYGQLKERNKLKNCVQTNPVKAMLIICNRLEMTLPFVT